MPTFGSAIHTIVVEVLASVIRECKEVKGLTIGDTEHKLVQYADDATLILGNIISVKNVLHLIKEFSAVAGPRLNNDKTKGIWLGPLKDLGIRTIYGITWTGNPVKCLGIYLGHNKAKCHELNWNKRVVRIEKLLNQWKQRSLTIEGKILILKTLGLSKLVFPASLLPIPNIVRTTVKKIMFEFLWGKRDKIKRSVIINDKQNGGLAMTDLDSFFESIKAAWIPRLMTIEGKWKHVLYSTLHKCGVDIDYVLKMNFRSMESCKSLDKIPAFYLEAFVAYNKCKTLVPVNLLSENSIFKQTLFGNELFKVEGKCLLYKSWCDAGIKYVRDIIGINGMLVPDNALYDLINPKQQLLHQMFTIKNMVAKLVKGCDLSLASFVNLRKEVCIMFNNKQYTICDKKSRFFYKILKQSRTTRTHMELKWSNMFSFENIPFVWKNIYGQKVINVFNKKFSEVCFKIIHNILPCGYTLSKWETTVKPECEVCNEIETMKHMLYDCPRVFNMWQKVSYALQFDVQWKHLVCGFIQCEINDKMKFINMMLTAILYAIFKCNSISKFDNVPYSNINIMVSVRKNLVYYRHIIENTTSKKLYSEKMFEATIDALV